MFTVLEFSLISDSWRFVSLSLTIITYSDIRLLYFNSSLQPAIQSCVELITINSQNISTIRNQIQLQLSSNKLKELKTFKSHATTVRNILYTVIEFAYNSPTNISQAGAFYRAVNKYKNLLQLVGKFFNTNLDYYSKFYLIIK